MTDREQHPLVRAPTQHRPGGAAIRRVPRGPCMGHHVPLRRGLHAQLRCHPVRAQPGHVHRPAQAAQHPRFKASQGGKQRVIDRDDVMAQREGDAVEAVLRDAAGHAR